MIRYWNSPNGRRWVVKLHFHGQVRYYPLWEDVALPLERAVEAGWVHAL